MKDTFSIKFAKAISLVFNPVILANLILLGAIYKSHMNANTQLGWYVSVLVLNIIIPLLVYLFFTSRGYIFDDTLKNKKAQRERIIILLVFLAVVTIELLMMVTKGDFFQPLYAVLIGGIAAIILASGISYFWKISMHSSAVTMFVLMILFIFGNQFWPAIFLIPLVWWARLVLHRHNIWQLLAGSILSIAVVYATFLYFSLI